MPTQVERRTTTQLAIVDAAATAYREQRSIDITLESIADAAGVTKGSILYHFNSRLGLLAEVARTIFFELVNEIEATQQSSVTTSATTDSPAASNEARTWSRSLLQALATPTGFVLYAIGDELTFAGELAETDPYPYLKTVLAGLDVPNSVDVTAASLTYFGRRLALGLEESEMIEAFIVDMDTHGLFG